MRPCLKWRWGDSGGGGGGRREKKEGRFKVVGTWWESSAFSGFLTSIVIVGGSE